MTTPPVPTVTLVPIAGRTSASKGAMTMGGTITDSCTMGWFAAANASVVSPAVPQRRRQLLERDPLSGGDHDLRLADFRRRVAHRVGSRWSCARQSHCRRSDLRRRLSWNWRRRLSA